MKKWISFYFCFILFASLQAQYPWEGSELDVTTDPSISFDLHRPIASTTLVKPELAPEMEFSNGRQTIKIPFAYPFGNFGAGINLPLQRRTVTSGDKSKSVIGLGDLVILGSYHSFLPGGFKGWSMDYAADLSIKLPTGDKDYTVKINNFPIPTPMGTGSLDFTAAANILLSTDQNSIETDLKLRLNTKDKDEFKNGDMLALTTKYGFLDFEPRFDGFIGLQVITIGDSKSGSTKVESSLFLLDFVPELHYLTPLGMFRIGFSLPLITSSEVKFTRDVSVRFGISKQY